MTTLLRKHSTIILISLLLAVLVFAWLFPSTRFFLGIMFLFFSFFIAGAAIFLKHREEYRRYSSPTEAEREGKLTRRVFIRTVSLEITRTWLAMILAGLLGRMIAQIATQPITDAITKMIVGIIIGLLVGIGVGVLVSQAWDRFAMSWRGGVKRRRSGATATQSPGSNL